MKKESKHSTLMRKIGSILLLVFVMIACDDVKDKPQTPPEEVIPINDSGTAELYILSEGLFNQNNSTLAKYSFQSKKMVKDFFTAVNQRGLGDTANSMDIYGNKLYVVVNVSSTVEIIDLLTGTSLKQIKMTNDEGKPRQPRQIAFNGNKAYVCSYDGTIARIDTTSLEIDAFTQAGRNPDYLCMQNGELYVSNSGALDWGGIGVDNTVSVINLATFKEEKRIEVGPNPGKILAGPDKNVFVIIRGNDTSTGGEHLVEINCQTNTVSKTYDEKAMNFAIKGNTAYLYNYNYLTQAATFKVFNLKTGETIRENFITDDTKISTPYAININPYSGNIYISDTFDYQRSGDLLCFTPEGKLLSRVKGVGLNPNAIVFSDKFSQSNVEDTPKKQK